MCKYGTPEGEIDSVRKVGNIYKCRVLVRLHGKIVKHWYQESYAKPKTGRFSFIL